MYTNVNIHLVDNKYEMTSFINEDDEGVVSIKIDNSYMDISFSTFNQVDNLIDKLNTIRGYMANKKAGNVYE